MSLYLLCKLQIIYDCKSHNNNTYTYIFFVSHIKHIIFCTKMHGCIQKCVWFNIFCPSNLSSAHKNYSHNERFQARQNSLLTCQWNNFHLHFLFVGYYISFFAHFIYSNDVGCVLFYFNWYIFFRNRTMHHYS